MICTFYSFHDFSGREFFWSFANYPNTRLILGVVSKSYFHFRKSFTNEYTPILKEAEFSEDVPSLPLIPFFTLDLPRSSSQNQRNRGFRGIILEFAQMHQEASIYMLCGLNGNSIMVVIHDHHHHLETQPTQSQSVKSYDSVGLGAFESLQHKMGISIHALTFCHWRCGRETPWTDLEAAQIRNMGNPSPWKRRTIFEYQSLNQFRN